MYLSVDEVTAGIKQLSEGAECGRVAAVRASGNQLNVLNWFAGSMYVRGWMDCSLSEH